MLKFIPVLAVLACLQFLACTPGPVGGEIANTYWTLSVIKEGNKETKPNIPSAISVIFSPDKVSGISICNRYQADYSTEGKTLSVTGLTATERMCDGINMENSFLGLLGKATGYSVLEDKLVIFANDGQLILKPMSRSDIEDVKYAEGVGRLVARFPVVEDVANPHFFPIVRVDRPGNYPYKGELLDPSLYQYFDKETSTIWNNPGGDVLAIGKYGEFFVCRVPGRYVSSDIALFHLEKGVMKRSETIAWAWCDEGWCNQQDAWLQDLNGDGRADIVQHYTLTDDKGVLQDERITVLVQTGQGQFEPSTEIKVNKADYVMAPI